MSSQALLTERQQKVLALIAVRKPYKQIAAELGISETRVKQHVSAIKQRLGANSMAELVAHFHAAPGSEATRPAPFTSGIEPKSEVPPAPFPAPQAAADDPGALRFEDSLRLENPAPWARPEEPRIVPGLLDGKGAALPRLLVIVLIGLGIMAAIILALTIGNTMSAELAGVPYQPAEKAN